MRCMGQRDASLLALVGHGDDLGVLLIHGSEAFLAVALVEHALWILLLMVLIGLHSLLVVVELDLFVDEFLVLWNFEAEEFEIKVKI